MGVLRLLQSHRHLATVDLNGTFNERFVERRSHLNAERLRCYVPFVSFEKLLSATDRELDAVSDVEVCLLTHVLNLSNEVTSLSLECKGRGNIRIECNNESVSRLNCEPRFACESNLYFAWIKGYIADLDGVLGDYFELSVANLLNHLLNASAEPRPKHASVHFGA